MKRLGKKVLCFSGGADAFLMGITSNVPDAPKNAFLDVQGRIVATFDQAKAPGCVYAAIEAPFAGRVAEHLKKYLLISDTRLEEKPALSAVYDLDSDAELLPGDLQIPQKKGRILLTARKPESEVSDAEFAWFRLQHAIPLQGADYDREMLLNLGDESYVSFTKGCYLGQEIVARVHHRAKPPRKLVVRKVQDVAPADAERMTSRAKDPQTGEESGFLFIENARAAQP